MAIQHAHISFYLQLVCYISLDAGLPASGTPVARVKFMPRGPPNAASEVMTEPNYTAVLYNNASKLDKGIDRLHGPYRPVYKCPVAV